MASKHAWRIFPSSGLNGQCRSTCINSSELSQRLCFALYSRNGHRKVIAAFRTRSYTSSSKSLSPIKKAQDTPRDASLLFDQQLQRASNVLGSRTVPDEKTVYGALEICENLATKFAAVTRNYGRSSSSSDGPTTSLLSIEDRAAASKGQNIDFNKRLKIKKISELAYKIAQDPQVFITRRILELYIRIQKLLGRPQSFPHIFDLFASKPIPEPGASVPTFKDSNVNSVSVAIPLPAVQDALNAAIEIKDLALCLNIIETGVSTSAFRRAKFLRKALLPVSALALSPVAAYNLAWQFSKNSDLVEPQTLTNFATVGIMTYIGITVSIGYVALTTANDQMDRITWIPGTPLSERWFREEERALIDQVAGAWGLKNIESRGGEEGWEWEELRRWTFGRGMYLDKPELMEGME